MRTTVRLDDDLYRRVKTRAAEQGRTVASVMEEAIRIGLEPSDDVPAAPVTLPTFDGPISTELASMSYGKMIDRVESSAPIDELPAF